MSGLIISVSGLRGIVGKDLTPDVASRFVSAYASSLPEGPILIGRDGRESGPMLAKSISAALTACGRQCLDAGVIATPTLGVLVRQRNAAGAVQISASHNPPPYNGIKLFGASGRVLDAEIGGKVRDAFFAGRSAWVPFDQIGQEAKDSDPHTAHLDAVLATVNVEKIRQAKYRVLLDSNHGAGGCLGIRLLEELGCEVVSVGAEPSGQFAHPPEPTAENLEGIAKRVKESGCSVGFCQDPDADRLALVDASGRYIGEEYTLALCVQRALDDPETRGTIVINGATSGMSERIAEKAGVRSFRSAVGEANVADLMIMQNAAYGGEGNGGPIDPRVGYVRDSFVGIAQVLDLMAATEKSLAELANDLPRLHIHKHVVSMDTSQLPQLISLLEEKYPDAEFQTGDGIRLAWDDRWLLVRGSNTEPIVRLIAEAEDPSLAEGMCRCVSQWIDESISGHE